MPFFIRKLFSGATYMGPGKNKTIYLTFDDGPTPGVTDKVMEMVESYNGKATFFQIGKHIKLYPELHQEVLDRGHAIGNHSMTHPHGWKTKLESYLENVKLCQEIYPSSYFRPPFGELTLSQYRALKDLYQIVMWDIVSYDFDENITAEICLGHVIDNYRPGSIIVFHDSVKAWRVLQDVLPETLARLADDGYEFKSL